MSLLAMLLQGCSTVTLIRRGLSFRAARLGSRLVVVAPVSDLFLPVAPSLVSPDKLSLAWNDNSMASLKPGPELFILLLVFASDPSEVYVDRVGVAG
jgi:hypothetical protein